MDDCQQYSSILHTKIEELNVAFTSHKEKLRRMLEKGEIPELDNIVAEFSEAMNEWKSVKDMNTILHNKIEQETLTKSIEVTGLPEHCTRNLGDVARALSRILRIPINESYVTGFRRLDDDLFREGFPRTLVVDLVSKNIKRRILTVAETCVLTTAGSDLPMTITEHLTPMNHRLLRAAKAEALRHGVNNVWVEEGKIFARRSDVSLIYEIRCTADINQMSRF